MARKGQDKVTCQYCGDEFSKAGITNHEKACSENPENQVEEVAEVEVAVEPEVVEEPVEEKVSEVKTVTIKTADKVDCYIGDRYYRFKKGEVVEVPVDVKNILRRAGMLEAI